MRVFPSSRRFWVASVTLALGSLAWSHLSPAIAGVHVVPAPVLTSTSMSYWQTNPSEQPNNSSISRYIWPAQGTITSEYGPRWGRLHTGVDIAGPVGTPILAAASGVVISSGWNDGGYGNLIKIQHADGNVTFYAHNQRLLVKQGQQVNQGQVIAEMGSTGNSTGPHCHFELRFPKQGAVNPTAYLPNFVANQPHP